MEPTINKKTDRYEGALIHITIWAAYSSAVIAALGLVFLALLYAGFPRFGTYNDLAVIAHYILLLPIMFALHRLLAADGTLKIVGFAIGLFGIVTVIILQSMLVLGIMPFRQQIVYVIPAFLVAMMWFVIIERLGRDDDRLPKGLALHILAGLVFGYPIWAYKLAKNLKLWTKGAT